ncbi:MAG: hypothetical protein N2578_02900 [Bdellovibrionaceae bacterium]|nr:hypothetical protein [Pseudobdellovibrionaceae bacterium]
MTSPRPEHERLFDEICNKLNELSMVTPRREHQQEEILVHHQEKIEKMQNQIREFQQSLGAIEEQLKEKIQSFDRFQIEKNSLNDQIERMSQQLQKERDNNTRISADLAKSLELNLQLQLELQASKAKAAQLHNEEKLLNQSLQEKIKALQNELEMQRAINEDTQTQANKARVAFENRIQQIEIEKNQLRKTIEELNAQTSELKRQIESQSQLLSEKDNEISSLNVDLEKLAQALEQMQAGANQQTEALRNLMTVAEAKISELKTAFDKKTLECNDYYSHLQQALTQVSLLKNENASLKEYIAKVNNYLHQAQVAPSTA